MRVRIIRFSCIFYLVSCILLTGCWVPIILVGAGIVTGFYTTRDTASGNIETTFDELWNTALKVIGERADITDQNSQAGLIRAKYLNNDIVVKIRELTEHSYNLKVTCRKATALANLKMAQELFTKIVRNLSDEDFDI